MSAPTPRPFLKWVGGKTQLLPVLRAAAPARFGRYFEPFLGGGALFFALRPKRATLSDLNGELVNAYKVVRDDVENLIELLGWYRYDKDFYLETRALVPEDLAPLERAARTIFLNKTCFNGVYRVNKSGAFNVPFGAYTNPLICDAENLRACSAALASADIGQRPFGQLLHDPFGPRAGDFVYFDPPYLPATATADFTAYTAEGFGLEAHRELAKVARRVAACGAHVLISNADVPAARSLYAGMPVRCVTAARSVGASKGSRASVAELLVG